MLVQEGISTVAKELREQHLQMCDQVISHVQVYEIETTERLNRMDEKIESRVDECY